MKRENGTERRAGKLPRFNAVDAVIILIVIAAIFGIWYRYGLRDKIENSRNMTEAVISFRISDIQEASGELLTDGTAVYYKTAGIDLGKLTGSAVISPAEVYAVNDNGETVLLYSVNGRIDAEGSILAEGVFKDGEGFFAGGTTYIAPGMKLDVMIGNLDVSVYVLDVK